jgi:UDP-glucose 4-epimerase
VNYSGKKIAITGANSFIGKALLNVLRQDETVDITILSGDTRHPQTFFQLDHSYDYLFHFAAPSSQVLFKRQPFYCADVTLTGFMNAAKMCGQFGIRLIYPSTGLLSSKKRNEYARCKEICEDIATGEKLDSLGLRIFATYGPSEGHKRDFASVPFLFARDMIAGREPVIFGDGEQVRDFIYIDDVVQAILHCAEECPDPVIDIGSGHSTSFNRILREINVALFHGDSEKYIEADYQEPPAGYVKETAADPVRLYDFYQPQVKFEDGIKAIVKHLKGGAQ